MRTVKSIVALVGFMLLAGCSGGLFGGGQADLMHVVESDSVRTVHPEGIYRAPAFQKSDNIHAEAIAKLQGHAAYLAQIKDREQYHVHDNHDLVVYLKSGRGLLKTESQNVSVEPGDWTFIPRGVAHQFVTTSDKPARAVIIRTPPAKEDRRRFK